MREQLASGRRRDLLKLTALPAVWSLPLVQSVVLPAHAQTTDVVPAWRCSADDIPGIWQLEILGAAASSSEMTLYADGSVDHDFINAWQYKDAQLSLTQGSTWMLLGTFDTDARACDRLSGTYFNVFSIPILGNVIIREGDWTANRKA